MVKTLKRGFDSELEGLIGVLIKKGMETGVFIGEQINEFLGAVCEFCSEAKVSCILLNILSGNKGNGVTSNPSPGVKIRSIMCFERLITRLGPKFLTFKDAEKIILMLNSLLSEGSLEVRNGTKQAFIAAYNNSVNLTEFDRLLHK